MSTDQDEFRAPWRTLAIGSILLNVATIGVIAVLSSLRNGDALSTVALSLAVLAFITQLIIFTIQTTQSGQQLKRAEELNSDTKTVLAEAATRIQGTHEMVSAHHLELLRLSQAKGDAEEAKASDASADAAGTSPVGVASQPKLITTPVPPSTDAVVEDMLEWPSKEEATYALEVLTSLPEGAQSAFVHDLADDVFSRLYGGTAGLSFSEGDLPLINAGLVRHGPMRAFDKGPIRTVVLTDEGRAVGRLLTAPWPPPDALAELAEQIWSLRESEVFTTVMPRLGGYLT